MLSYFLWFIFFKMMPLVAFNKIFFFADAVLPLRQGIRLDSLSKYDSYQVSLIRTYCTAILCPPAALRGLPAISVSGGPQDAAPRA